MITYTPENLRPRDLRRDRTRVEIALQLAADPLFKPYLCSTRGEAREIVWQWTDHNNFGVLVARGQTLGDTWSTVELDTVWKHFQANKNNTKGSRCRGHDLTIIAPGATNPDSLVKGPQYLVFSKAQLLSVQTQIAYILLEENHSERPTDSDGNYDATK